MQNELKGTEDILKEIQSNQLDSSESKTSEKNKAIEELQRKILSIRKQLRDVQRQLNADIERLENNIKILNIWTMPIIVIILYFFIKVFTEKRRKEFYRKIGRLENK